jgi:hypothetical protein
VDSRKAATEATTTALALMEAAAAGQGCRHDDVSRVAAADRGRERAGRWQADGFGEGENDVRRVSESTCLAWGRGGGGK